MRLQLDPKGAIWVATDHGLDEFDPRSKRFIHYPELNGSLSVGLVTCFVRDRRGMLWLGTNEAGLVRFDPATRRYEVYKNQPGNSATLSSNRVNALLVDADGTLWVGTQLGLNRFDGATQQFHAYTERDALPSNAVEGILEDRQRNLWVGTDNGLAKVTPSTNSVRTYYASDGLAGSEFNYWGAPFQDTHGEMFFPGVNGLTAFYPDKIRDNSYVPPLVLTDFRLFNEPVPVGPHSLLKKGISYTQSLELSHAQSIFSFEFAALSYQAPATNRYRYRLEDLDRGWNLVSSKHRLVTYTTLPPGDYVFRVQGSNNRGVWNENGTSIRIRILPPWWGTWWFRTVCVAVSLALLWVAYQLRVRQLHQQFNMRLEERVNERTRIARDLHDTLLQSFHGLLLRFQAAANLLPEGEAKAQFEGAIDLAAQAITEGRDAIQGLRLSTIETNDLASAISTLGQELAAGETNPNAAEFHVGVEGTSRDLHPILRDEIYRIAGEAMRNAFKHAQAHQIEVEIRYDERQLRLRVRDDGKGIDPKLLHEDGRPGHFGLRGMRERAKLSGGKLTVWSELDSGTELELSIPASRAYATSAGRRRS
jgi:signal transduction histidine kinase